MNYKKCKEVSYDSGSLIRLRWNTISLEQFIYDQYNRFASYLMNIEKSEYCSQFLALDNNGYTWKDKVYATLLSFPNTTLLL